MIPKRLLLDLRILGEDGGLDGGRADIARRGESRCYRCPLRNDYQQVRDSKYELCGMDTKRGRRDITGGRVFGLGYVDHGHGTLP